MRVRDPSPPPLQVDPSRADRFYATVRCYLPSLPDGALQPAYCGIRPKVTGPGQPDADFLVQVGLMGVIRVLWGWGGVIRFIPSRWPVSPPPPL